MISQYEARDAQRGGRRVLRATIDVSARFVGVSPGWLPLLGWDGHTLLGESFVVRVHPDDLEAAVGAIHGAIGGGAVCFAARYAHRDGTYLALRWRIAPRLDRLQLQLTGRPAPPPRTRVPADPTASADDKAAAP